MVKIALITGITGQDGAYLAKSLLEKNYRVYGLSRAQNPDLSNLKYLGIENQVEVNQCDLLNAEETKEKIANLRPAEIYNLSAQSSVDYSFRQPAETMTYNVNSVINLLEAVRQIDKNIKFYQATSCEIYGHGNALPVDETSPLFPSSPYGVSKAGGHLLVRNYRETYGLYCASGILFNHESHLRRPEFFIRRLIRTAQAIAKGGDEYVYLGQADNRRDFGWSPDYVEAMHLMLQQATPEDYIICSGRSVSIREIAEYVLTKFNLSTTRIKIDEKLFRSPNIPDLYGDPTKAREKLGWKYDKNFFEVLDILIEEELTDKTQ